MSPVRVGLVTLGGAVLFVIITTIAAVAAGLL